MTPGLSGRFSTMVKAKVSRLLDRAEDPAETLDYSYPDSTFDAAILTTVLGEIPNQYAALRDLARVLKPGGRLIVGELFGDPHWVSPNRLRRRAEAAGLTFNRRSGTPLGYFARFDRAGAVARHEESQQP